MEKKLLNYSEAAKILGITRQWVYALITTGQLHPVEVADRKFLKRVEVEKVKRERAVKE